MLPGKEHYTVDFYHSLGSYWSVECGLFRTEEDVQKCIVTYLFPSLHHMTDNHDVLKILNVICDNRPDVCPEELNAAAPSS
eukprot:scaffold154722_cov36-Cyclotella_meneghiniana.AAC.10